MSIWVKFLMCTVLSNASTASYLSFSSITNPSNTTISLTVTSSAVSSVYQTYTIEFWMRPFFPPPNSGTVTLMQNPNDWNIYYSTQTQSIRVASVSTNLDYCQIPNVPNKIWTHVVVAYDYINQIFYCYLNATQITSVSLIAVAKYPSKLIIGNNYYGNLYELRVWIGEIRSPAEIFQYFSSVFVSPLPSSLIRLWRLSEGSKATQITDLVQGTITTISSKLKLPWLIENPPSLFLCSTGTYLSNNTCVTCGPACDFCEGLGQCYNSGRSFMDFKRAGNSADTVFVGNCLSTSIGTLEFWFMADDWGGSGAELIKILNFVTIAQKGFSKSIGFYDGNNNEVLVVPVQTQVWTHVAWVYSPSKVTIYVDFDVYTVIWTNSSSSILYLGGSTSVVRFDGIISDLRLWATSRNSTQVLSNLYTNYLNVPSDLFRFFPLNTTGNTISSTNMQSTTTKTIIASLWRTLNCTVEGCLFECPFKYFADLNGNCWPCDPSCQACSGPLPSDCTVCLPTDLRVPNQSNCYSHCPNPLVAFGTVCQSYCPSTYYNNSGFCNHCTFPCQNCSTLTYCTSCADGYQLYPNRITNNCVKICPNRQYRNDNNTCQNCSSVCAECSGSGINDCLACNSSMFLYKYTCVNQCGISTFTDGVSCFDCDSSCLTCIGGSASDCVTCSNLYPYQDYSGLCYSKCPTFLVNGTYRCVDLCPNATYSLNNTCYKCDPSCLECFGPSSYQCSSCPVYKYQGRCFSQCPDGSYLLGNSCYDCDVSCDTCFTSPTHCLSCSLNFPYYSSNTCYSKCPNLLLPPYQCVDICSKGFTNINSTCIQCDPTCKECLNTPTQCISCDSDMYLFNNTCVDFCPNEYFSSNLICYPCSSSCGNCTDFNFCTSCSNSSLYFNENQGTCTSTCSQSTFALQNLCIEECPNTFYADPNRFCQSCSEGCFTCSSSLDCSECYSQYFNQERQCVQNCSNGFYPDTINMMCIPCESECAECFGNGINNCSLCKDSKLIYIDSNGIGSCLNTCPIGSFPSGNFCEYCLKSCNSCFNNYSCIDCKQGYFMKNNGTCVDRCDYGDIGIGTTCYGFQNFLPRGQVDLSTFTNINITYSLPITIGSKFITLYSVFNGSYTQVGRYQALPNSYIVGNTLCTVIPISDLRYNTDYSLSYDANVILSSNFGNVEIPVGIFYFSTMPYKLKPLYTIINGNTKSFQVNVLSQFKLSANGSFDPSSYYAQSTLNSFWTCSDISSSYLKYLKTYKSTWNQFIFQIDQFPITENTCSDWDYSKVYSSYDLNLTANSQINVVRKFSFTLFDSSRNSTSSIYVLTVPISYENVKLENVPVYKVNTDKKVSVVVSNPNTNNKDGYQWGYFISEGGDLDLMTPLFGSWVLSIPEYSLQTNSKYSFSISYSDEFSLSNSVFTIVTNSPPELGLIISDKSAGLAILDSFVISMPSWSDPDLPLSYLFVVNYDQENIEYQLTGYLNSSQIQIGFSQGIALVTGFCIDSLGASSNKSVILSITSTRNFQVLVQEIQALPEINTNNYMNTLSNINALARELDYPYPDTESILVQKKFLLALLRLANDLAYQYFVMNKNYECIYIYYSIIGCIETLFRGTISQEVLDIGIEILNSIDLKVFSENLEFYFEGSDTYFKSTQEILRDYDFYNLCNMFNNIGVHISEFSNLFTQNIQNLIKSVNSLLGTNANLFEPARVINTDSSIYYYESMILTDLQGKKISLNDSSIFIPSSLNVSSSKISINAVFSNVNSFNSSEISLNQYISLTLLDQNNTALEIVDQSDPFAFTFNVSREELWIIANNTNYDASGLNKFIPICTYWDFSQSEWNSKGCFISNPEGINDYFGSLIFPEYALIQCSCTHLSYFSAIFSSSASFSQSNFIIHGEKSNKFNMNKWSNGIVLYFMIVGIGIFIGLFAFAYRYDKNNESEKIIQTSQNFGFWDSAKIQCLIEQLDKKFIDENDDKGKIANSIKKIANSALFNKFSDVEHDSKQEKQFGNQEVENFYKINPIFNEKNKKNIEKNEGLLRIKKYLEKGVGKSGNEEKNITPRKKIENLKDTYREKLTLIEQNQEHVNEIDEFLAKYDGLRNLSVENSQKFHSKIPDHLKTSSLAFLGYKISDFYALKATPMQLVQPNLNSLTPACYSYLDWDYSKSFSHNNYCVWGCRYESQMLMGIISGILPWPLVYSCKLLLAKTLIDYRSHKIEKYHLFRIQAYEIAKCKEYAAVIFAFFFIFGSILAIIVISEIDPFEEGQKFLFCYISSLIWTIVVSEILTGLAKAWLIWMANPKNLEKRRYTAFWARFAKTIMEVFPCTLPTEL